MTSIFTALDGAKSYIVAFVVALLGLLNAFGIVEPTWVDSLLGAFGIVAARSAISKIAPATPATK